ncbi:MAG: DUF554 domain-containing protein [Armatimonadota bacterium]
MKGTWLNAGTVLVGGLIGTVARAGLPKEIQTLVLSLLGLTTLAMGVGMFARTRNPVIVTAALALGGILGYVVGLQPLLDGAGETLRGWVHGGGRFTEGFVAATVLFCVGPMTILGCLEDGLSGKSPLLALKSTLDGFAALFLAAGLGMGVVFSVFSVLIIQGVLTRAAQKMARVRDDEELLAEISGVGGPIIVGIGLSLLDLKRLPMADTLPALLIAPAIVLAGRRLRVRN